MRWTVDTLQCHMVHTMSACAAPPPGAGMDSSLVTPCDKGTPSCRVAGNPRGDYCIMDTCGLSDTDTLTWVPDWYADVL